jgi:hypothetical protein
MTLLVVRMMPQLGALLTDDSRSIIYDHNHGQTYSVSASPGPGFQL